MTMLGAHYDTLPACVTWDSGWVRGELPHEVLPSATVGGRVWYGCERCGAEFTDSDLWPDDERKG